MLKKNLLKSLKIGQKFSFALRAGQFEGKFLIKMVVSENFDDFFLFSNFYPPQNMIFVPPPL